MAVYNGAAFISEQLQSIMMQLGPDDELIAVDDGSTDASESIILGMDDPRIRYLRNACNKGVIKTFERALSEARGEIVFLSDQDDIWADHKIRRTLEVFERTGALCILSDALLVNGANQSLGQTFFAWRTSRPGLLRNWLRNSFMGCTMAFRRELAAVAIPFPDRIYMHDQWLGMLATAAGKVVFLREPLIRYRRHGNNVTTMTRAEATTLVRRRLIFAVCLICRLPQVLKLRLAARDSVT